MKMEYLALALAYLPGYLKNLTNLSLKIIHAYLQQPLQLNQIQINSMHEQLPYPYILHISHTSKFQ
jgi:hypothetical protein